MLQVKGNVVAKPRDPGMPGPGHGLFLWALGSFRKILSRNMVIFVVLYQGQPGLIVVAGLDRGW